TVDGEPLEGVVYRRYDQELFDGGGTVVVANTGNQPTEMRVSVTGIPEEPPPESSAGFTITRTYYMPDGALVEMGEVTRNERFVGVLAVTGRRLGSGPYVVAE